MTIELSPLTRATLHAGGRRAEYVAGGRGPAVVLLHPRPEGEAARRLVGDLASRHRVVAPLAIDGLACSLDELFEGLGIERAALIIEATVAGAATAFVVGHGDRLSRVALLRSSADDVGPLLARWSEGSLTARVWVEADVVRDAAVREELLSYLAASDACSGAMVRVE